MDKATKASLIKKKGKAVLTDDTPSGTAENNKMEAVKSKHPRTDDPYPRRHHSHMQPVDVSITWSNEAYTS
jgi:hypothetical protein